MIDRKEKTCKNCLKAPPHSWRTLCLKCINSIAKEKQRAIKMKNIEKVKVKKEKILEKKRFSRTNLVKEADRVASLYIRERDKWKSCVTCYRNWEENFQCGHFMSRKHFSTRWHEKNMHWQCPACNLYGSGEQYKHSLAVDRMYWIGTAEQIMRLSNESSKTTDDEILHYIRLYYYELSQLWWTNEQIWIKKYYLKASDSR